MVISIFDNAEDNRYTFKFAAFGCELSSQFGDLLLRGPWGEVFCGWDTGLGIQLWGDYSLVWETFDKDGKVVQRIPRIDRVGRFRWVRNTTALA